MGGGTDLEILIALATMYGWERTHEHLWDEGDVVTHRIRVDQEPTSCYETSVWRHGDYELVVHFDWRTTGDMQTLQPVFWKHWEVDRSDDSVNVYMSSHHMARVYELYPTPSEGLVLNRRWMMGSLLDMLSNVQRPYAVSFSEIFNALKGL